MENSDLNKWPTPVSNYFSGGFEVPTTGDATCNHHGESPWALANNTSVYPYLSLEPPIFASTGGVC